MSEMLWWPHSVDGLPCHPSLQSQPRWVAENLVQRSWTQQSETYLLAVFTGWKKIYNQSKSGFMAKRQIFLPLQPWEILNVVERKQFCFTQWGKEEHKVVSKGRPHFFGLHSKAGRPSAGRTAGRLEVCNCRRSRPGPVIFNHTNYWVPELQRC